MKQILSKVKKNAIPSKKLQHDKKKIADFALELVEKQTSKYSEVIDVEIGGSYAKGTWLPKKADIDIFIKFEKSTNEKKFSEISKKIGFDSMKKFKPYVRYSEHPYVEAVIKNTKINVVPCYDVEKGKWKSAADRSTFHTKFMLKSLDEKMKDEVRLLKEFVMNNQVYGSEIAKQGFSGYVTEVLIWNFKSFENVIKKISKIKSGDVIGNSLKKFDTPIVIMDPIDNNRNLAAAISPENIGKFVLLCRSFLKNPTISFFITQKNKKFIKNLNNVVVIKFNFKPRSPDIIWGQLKRAANALSIQFDLAGFVVLRNSVITDESKEASLFFLMESLEIGENELKTGPEFFSENDSLKFISKNSKKSKLMWINKKGKILSLHERKYVKADLFVIDLLKKNLNSGIPQGLKKDLKTGFSVVTGNKVKSKSIKEALLDLVSTDAKIFSSN